MTTGYNDLAVGTVRVHRVNATATELKDEQSASRVLAAGSRFRFRICRQNFTHDALLSRLNSDATVLPHLFMSVCSQELRGSGRFGGLGEVGSLLRSVPSGCRRLS